MSNLQLTLIIVGLLSILPSIIIFTVLWARLIEHARRIEAALGGKDDIQRLETENKDLISSQTKIQSLIESLNESLLNLINKINSRHRTEQIKEAKEKKEEEDEEEDIDKISPVFPLDAPVNAQPRQTKMILQRKL